MTEELRQAKEKVKWEVEYAIKEAERLENNNNFEVEWVLEEFRNQIVAEINKRLK